MILFELGQVEIRPTAAAALKANNQSADELLSRHQQGDWGTMDEIDHPKNDAALKSGHQLFRLASVTDDLPFAAGQFDFVVCALMLSHIPNLAQVAQKFHDYLQADGHLLITMFHPDTIINHGWRTTFDGPGISYGLPNVSRSRADYLETLSATGFNVLNAIDAPLRDVPAGIIPPAFIEEMGDVNFCLIILAQKGSVS